MPCVILTRIKSMSMGKEWRYALIINHTFISIKIVIFSVTLFHHIIISPQKHFPFFMGIRKIFSSRNYFISLRAVTYPIII